MTRRILLLAATAMLALALCAPAALAQDFDDDFDDDDYAAPVTAQQQPLPDTGGPALLGPALLAPAAGALLLGSGIVVGVRRINRD